MNTDIWDTEGKCSKGIRNRHHLRKHLVMKHQKDFVSVCVWLKRHLKHLEILVNHKDLCQGNEQNTEPTRHVQCWNKNRRLKLQHEGRSHQRGCSTRHPRTKWPRLKACSSTRFPLWDTSFWRAQAPIIFFVPTFPRWSFGPFQSDEPHVCQPPAPHRQHPPPLPKAGLNFKWVFPPASETNATSVSTRISEHEISFQYSVHQKGVDNVRKRLDVEGTQRKFNHCLLQLCDRSHLALTLTHTPEFCWQQQLLISPSILVPLQILPTSSSYMWALAVLRVSTEGQNSLIRSCFPISFGQQWWIFQILQEILQQVAKGCWNRKAGL